VAPRLLKVYHIRYTADANPGREAVALDRLNPGGSLGVSCTGEATYRTIYTVRFAGAVYVLHAFQKKSKKGIKTPFHEIDLIKARYEKARIAYEHEFGGPKGRTP
jgi:hypothetical protein